MAESLFDEYAWKMMRKGSTMEKRIAITKQVMEGMSYRAVGEAFDLSASRVGAIVSRTMRELARILPRDVQECAFPQSKFPMAYRDYGLGAKVHMATMPLSDLRKVNAFLIDQLTEMQDRLAKER